MNENTKFTNGKFKHNSEENSKKLFDAAKWSTLTEIMSKLVTPISSMILARILVPEMFGIVASVNMVISFCDIFADAGFQKYIIQHETENDVELKKITNVAFWTNLCISVFLWMIVAVFSEPIAKLVGCAGHYIAVCVSCSLLPLHALSSLPTALLKRKMDFHTLFIVRMVTIAVPFVVTLPLALITRSYWALICGSIANGLVTAIVTMWKAGWKPNVYFNWLLFKDMISFSLWSMLEAVLVWVINWGDMFIVGFFLSSYYLGIYKTSINMVNSIFAVISSSISSVMLSALSRMQSDEEQYKETFYKISFYSGLLLIPMGVGMFIYQNAMCNIVLGSAWSEGAVLMGIWGLVSSFAILFNNYNGCIYISKGKPKISAIVQIAQIILIIPTVYFSVQISFNCLAYSRALIRIAGMIIHCCTVWFVFKISALKTIKLLIPALFATGIMALFGVFFVSLNLGLLFEIVSILICVVVYFVVVMVFPSVRKPLMKIAKDKIVKSHEQI